jgi:hypothetical protein
MEELNVENSNFLVDLRNIILQAKSNAVNSIEFVRVQMYWNLGKRIFIEEQTSNVRQLF